MASMTQAAVAASVLVGLMAVPAASQTVDFQESSLEDISDISASEELPEEVSRTTSADSFRASISTAFSDFTTAVVPGSANATLEDSTSSLEVSRSPSRTEWKLTTPEGTITKIESSRAEIEKVSTPQGNLRSKTRNGAETVEFSGSNRDRVEKKAHELRQMLEDRRTRLERKKERIRQQSLPDIEVIANESSASGFGDNDQEHVVIRNNEFEEINLQGWKIQDDSGSHEFGSVIIGPREKFHVYSGDSDDVENPERPAVLGTSIAWNDGGDTATLLNVEGVEISEKSY